MSRSLYRLACALAAAGVASQTAAQAPEPSPYAPPPATPGAAPAAPVASARPAPPFRPRFYLGMGYDIGGAQIVPVQLSDGSRPSLRYNAGLLVNGGGDFLPLAGGLFHTRATIGVRFRMINASNGDITHMAFPLEVVEFVNLAPVRLGAGLGLALGPRTSASGAGTIYQAWLRDLKTTAGIAIQGEYEFGGGRGSGFTIGARYLIQKVQFQDGGSVDGNSLGIYLGWLP